MSARQGRSWRGAVGRAVRGGLARKRVQTIVIGLVLAVSTTACVLAAALVVDSSSPFDHAFAAQRGAHVAVAVDTALASSAQLAATRRLTQVTAAAGPFATAVVSGTVTGDHIPGIPGGEPPGGLPLPQLTLAGRAAPAGPVDDLVIQSGHWPTAPGQVVMDSSALSNLPPVSLGSKITISGAGHARKQVLTVVGTASSITGTAGGWVVPSEIPLLRSPALRPSAQMLYRFASSATDADIRADVAAVTKALPAGAVTGTQSYLAADLAQTGNIAPFVPFLIAFGIIGLVMSALIVTNVVSGAVVAGYRRIGVLKSIGFTPAQIVAAYAGQAAVPAIIGCAAGVLAGNLLAIPVLSQAAGVYGVGALGVPAWLDAAAPVALLGLVAVAAVLPALRAGQLSAVQAIATGRAPHTGRGYGAHRLLGRLALPRPVTIGLAAPFARPARAAMTLAAILLGAAAVTFSVGLSSSLTLVTAALSHAATEQVQVDLPTVSGAHLILPHLPHGRRVSGSANGAKAEGLPAGKMPSAAVASRTVRAALAAEPGTLHYVAEAQDTVTVTGLAQQVEVTAFRGDSGWTGYSMISGHWFTGPGQVDVATHFLTVTGKAVGDTVTFLVGNRQVTAKIVGQVFATRNDGLYMVTDWPTLARADHSLAARQYDVQLRPGTSVNAYVAALGKRLRRPDYFITPNDRSSNVIDLMVSLIGLLTLMLAIAAGLGVLNTIVLNTRERVHDLGVFKAIGMTPRQTIAMVVCWVAGTGLVASLVAVPVGVLLHGWVLPAMAHSVDLGVPAAFLNVYHGGELALLALAGVAIAVAGALLPASWAAATRTGTALRAE